MKTHMTDDKLEVGIDEAGCGCFFGRVYVGAVVWPRNWDPDDAPYEIKDSKKITSEKRRKILRNKEIFKELN